MTQQVINIGAAEEDGTGDTNRASFDKCNQNFTELYSAPYEFVSYSGLEDEPIEGKIAQFVTGGVSEEYTIKGVDSATLGFQPLDADLTAIAALTGTDTIYYRSGTDVWSPVEVGAGLDFASGTLTATGGSGGAAEYIFSTNTSAPPSSGQIRLNNATQSSATIVWVSNVTNGGVDLKRALETTPIGANLILQDESDSSQYANYQVAGALVDGGTYWEIPVTFLVGGSALGNQQRIMFSIQTGASYAPLASPTFTGDPKAPTPTAGDNDTSIATTAFVTTAISTGVSGLAALASPTFTGDPKAPTPTAGDNDTSIATTAFVKAQGYLVSTDLASYAPRASPALTGNPTAPTPTAGDNDTSIATTAFVAAAVAAGSGGAPVGAEYITSTTNATLTSERVLTDTATVTWDRTTAGQVKANAVGGSGFSSIVVPPQTFTASGTYTPTAGMKYCIIECVGGGGGGGGIGDTTGGSYGGGGGGSGGYSRRTVNAAAIGASQVVTIGTAGTAGASGGGNGGGGGTTSVGALCIALGGGGGGGQTAGLYSGGTGGAAGSAGDVVAAGNPGVVGSVGAAGNYSPAGTGGSSFFGGGGRAPGYGNAASLSVVGGAAANYGSGGSGAWGTAIATPRAGGAGSAGFVVIAEYV